MYAVVGGLAAAENVFPPLPADTAVALGAFLSHFGAISALSVFAVTWTANVASAAAVYLAGRTLGRPFFQGRLGRRLLKPAALATIERLYHRHGVWGIFVSRFIPGVRAVVPPFAGVARLGVARVLPSVALASALWYGILTYIAASVAHRLDDLVDLVRRVNVVAVIAAAVTALVAAGIAVQRRRLRRGPGGAADRTP